MTVSMPTKSPPEPERPRLVIRRGKRRLAIDLEAFVQVVPLDPGEIVDLPAPPPGFLGLLPFRRSLVPVWDGLAGDSTLDPPALIAVMSRSGDEWAIGIDRVETIARPGEVARAQSGLADAEPLDLQAEWDRARSSIVESYRVWSSSEMVSPSDSTTSSYRASNP